jgi:hypothetical protein
LVEPLSAIIAIDTTANLLPSMGGMEVEHRLQSLKDLLLNGHGLPTFGGKMMTTKPNAVARQAPARRSKLLVGCPRRTTSPNAKVAIAATMTRKDLMLSVI